MANWFQSRQVREGSYSGVYILVFIAILVAAYYLADQYNKTFDATSDKLYSLSDQTTQLLSDLEEDVTIYHFDQKLRFEQPDMNGMSPKGSLTRYENASNKVTVEYIDPDSDPATAQRMNVRSYGTTYVSVGGQREEASSVSEEDVTNALIKLLKGEAKTACILAGHGEASTADFEAAGFSVAQGAIEDANYGVEQVSLVENPEVPASCSVLIVPGGENDLFPPEVEILKGYVEGGGRLFLMIDHAKSPSLVDLVAQWGVQVNDDLVLDTSSIGRLLGAQPVVPLAMNYEPHPITDPLTESGGMMPTLFPLTRSVNAAEEIQEGWTVDELLSTSAGSFATTAYESDEIAFDSSRDREGPINLAVAASYDVPEPPEPAAEEAEGDEEIAAEEPEELEGRVVVVGTSRFARNASLGRGNLDLFLNMLNWLTSDEDLISIRPKDPASTPMELTQSEMLRLFFAFVVGIPLIIVVAGVRTWWVRR